MTENNCKMTQYLSVKLKVLSFISIILVIYIHTYYTEGESMSSLMAVEGFWGKGICLVAVPLFYVISGYLFFLKCPNGLHSIWPKMAKRVRTLLVPYMLMNTFAILFYVILNLMVLVSPTLNSVVNFHILDTISQQGIVKSLLAFYWTDPTAFQLWFVRDLMVVIIFAPLIYILLRYMVKGFLGLILFFVIEAILLTLAIKLSAYFGAAFWFIAGGFIVMHPEIRITAKNANLCWVIASLIIFVSLCCINISHPLTCYQWLIPIAGIITLWLGYDILFQNKPNIFASKPYLVFWCSYTFFVYLVHEPLLNILKKLPLLVSRSECMLLTAYIVIPPLFYYLASWLGKWLKHELPHAYSIFTGNR